MSSLLFLLDARPVFTNDAVVLGILMAVLAGIFYTSSLDSPGWKKFYTYVPSLLLCYFLPALLNWPLGLISPHWYEPGVYDFAQSVGVTLTQGMNYNEITALFETSGIDKGLYKAYQGHSQLYFVASRYLLPASLLLLCLGIDLKGLINLGPKALIMFGCSYFRNHYWWSDSSFGG